MNWQKIQQAWERGDKQIAVRLLQVMVTELALRQSSLFEYQGGEPNGRGKAGSKARR